MLRGPPNITWVAAPSVCAMTVPASGDKTTDHEAERHFVTKQLAVCHLALASMTGPFTARASAAWAQKKITEWLHHMVDGL